MTIFVVLYFSACAALALYGLNCHVMTLLFWRTRRGRLREDRMLLRSFYGGLSPVRGMRHRAGDLPTVTTQIPLYNEANVALRVIEAAARFIYPRGRHEIQVLDDSTDQTVEIVARRVEELRSMGVDIVHVRRGSREGFKAGALAEGMRRARGEILAVFDADFLPRPDFLLRAAPFFVRSPRCGFIQGRWEHLNRDENWITRLQAIGIDGHFMVEQSARNYCGLFMNFNGTAGLFRRRAIEEAGGWQADTLTEDMDLSYRIQLAGWSCRYLSDLAVPAEIPSRMGAFKSQQFRWAKGSIQTARKLLDRVRRAPVSRFKKVQALMHMTHYLVHPLMTVAAFCALPLLLLDPPSLSGWPLVLAAAFLVAGTTGPWVLYLSAQKALGRSVRRTLLLMPAMVCLGCGLAMNNSRAVLEALLGRPSEFVRTPKRGLNSAVRYAVGRDPLVLAEFGGGLWCLAGTGAYWSAHHWVVGHFMLLYASGFLIVAATTWLHARRDG